MKFLIFILTFFIGFSAFSEEVDCSTSVPSYAIAETATYLITHNERNIDLKNAVYSLSGDILKTASSGSVDRYQVGVFVGENGSDIPPTLYTAEVNVKTDVGAICPITGISSVYIDAE